MLTPDPFDEDIRYPQSLNRYAYVLNNPTTLTDPLVGLGQQGGDPCSGGPGSSTWMPVCTPGLTLTGGFLPTWDEFDTLENATGTSPAQQSGTQQNGTETVSLFAANGSLVQSNTTPIDASFDFAIFGPQGGGSSFSWSGTFAKSLVSNFPKTTLKSTTTSNGCLNQFFWNTLSNLNPFTPSASSLA